MTCDATCRCARRCRRWVPLREGLVAAVAALALAGCGTTVPLGAVGTVGAAGLGSSATGSAGSGGTGGSAFGAAPAGAGLSNLQYGAGRAQSGGAAAPASAPAALGPAARSVPARAPIRIGVIYTPGLDAAASAIGIKGLSTGDTSAQAAAVVAWVNAHGGLGGHQIQLYKYAINLSASSQDAAYGAACTAMTQDYRVRYVVTILSIPPSMMPCLAKGGVGLLDDESSLGDATMSRYSAFLANPGEFAPGRKMSVMVDDLWKRGWLTSASKAGVLAVDNTDGHAVVDGALAAALQRHGLKAANTQYVNPTGGDGGSSQSSAAALQFRSAGVDRVIPVLYSPLYFMSAAESQHYYPAYALDSSYGPGALIEATVPKDQLANSAGIGWQPFLDIGKGTKPGPVSTRETLCFDLMKNSGQASTSPTTEGFQVQVCNVLFYLQDLAARLSTIPSDLLPSGRRILGKAFVAADTFRTDVTYRTDGVAGYRALAFRNDCGCFQYVSPVEDAP